MEQVNASIVRRPAKDKLREKRYWVNPLSGSIHKQILLTDLHVFS